MCFSNLPGHHWFLFIFIPHENQSADPWNWLELCNPSKWTSRLCFILFHGNAIYSMCCITALPHNDDLATHYSKKIQPPVSASGWSFSLFSYSRKETLLSATCHNLISCTHAPVNILMTTHFLIHSHVNLYYPDKCSIMSAHTRWDGVSLTHTLKVSKSLRG